MGKLNCVLQLPILDDDHAASIYEFLQDCMQIFETHYGSQLNAYYSEEYSDALQGDQRFFDDEIPF